MTLSAQEARERNSYLETVGRRTGSPHEIEIWFAVDERDAATIYMLSGGRDRSDWVRNIRSNPSVRLRVNGATYHGTARVIEGDEPVDRVARETVAAKYQGWRLGQPLSQWGRESRAVVIHLNGDGSEDGT